MAKITREQLEKMNSQLHNDFKMDLMNLMCGDKVPTKKVTLNSKQYVSASLYFREHYNREDYTKSNHIDLNISLWRRSENGTSVSHGLGKWYTLEKDLKRKNFKNMVEHSAKIDSDLILSIYKENENVLNDGLILK